MMQSCSQKNFKSDTVINLTNIDYVYDKDPKKYNDAKKYETIPWKEFRKIVGDRWDPGLNAPFDPIASKMAERLGLKVIIIEGSNTLNLTNILENKIFIGTTIE